MSLQDRATAESRAAYHRAKHDGTITGWQLKALNILKAYGPSTAKEAAQAAGVDFPGLQKRLSELVDCGLVQKLPARKCRVSGHSAAVWRATSGAAESGYSAPASRSPTPEKHAQPVSISPATTIQIAARDPDRATLYRGGARVGCGCGTVNFRACERCGVSACFAPGHEKHVCGGGHA